MNKAFEKQIEEIVWEAMNMVGEKPILHFIGRGALGKATKKLSKLISARDKRLVERIDKLPVVLVDVKPSPDDRSKIEQAVLLSDVVQLIREGEEK